MDTPFERLVIPNRVAEAIFAHAHAELPRECCGILTGTLEANVGRVSRHFPVRNDLASQTRYFTNARDLLAVSKETRATGEEWLAVYHSHPTTAAIPSQTDLTMNTYGLSVVHVILGWVDFRGTGFQPVIPRHSTGIGHDRLEACPTTELRGWWLHEAHYVEAPVSLVGEGREA